MSSGVTLDLCPSQPDSVPGQPLGFEFTRLNGVIDGSGVYAQLLCCLPNAHLVVLLGHNTSQYLTYRAD